MRALRHKPLESLFFAMLAVATLVPSVCGVGLVVAVPAFAIFVERLLVASERLADDSPTRVGRGVLFSTGSAALLCVAMTLVAAGGIGSAVGIALTEAFSRIPAWGPIAAGAAAILAAMLLAAAFAPLAYVPFAAADRRLGLVAGVVRGLEIASRDRRLALSRTAALAALALVGPPTVPAVAAVYVHGDDTLGMLSLALLVPCLAMSTAMIATRYVSVRRQAPPPDDARRLAPVLRASFALMPLAAALVVGTAGWAIATPSLAPPDPSLYTRSWLRSQPHEVASVELALSTSEDVMIPHSFVRVRAVSGGIRITTPDGGGAGVVRCASFGRYEVATHVSVDVADDSLSLHVVGLPSDHITDPTCLVRVNRSGVRLDDDLFDRLSRGSWLFPLGVWLAFFGFLWLVSDAVRHAIDARVLAAADLSRDDAGGGLRALEGTVVGSGETRHLEVAGGELRFRLPSRRVFADGATITVLARFTGALGLGTRDAPKPLPRGARVVVGGAEDARMFLVEQASRSAIVATLIVIAGSVFAAVSLLVPLLSGA